MKWLVRIGIVLAVLTVFVYLFIRTAHDARSEPYTVERPHLQTWTVVVEPAGGTSSPILVVRPSQELSSGLFRQIFSRMMESLRGSTDTSVPLVLRSEYEMSLAARYTLEELADIARASGLEDGTLAPRCVAVKRISQPDVTRQLYYVVFDSPAFVRFREQIAQGLPRAPGAIAFDSAALSPIMIVAATDAAFDSWLPIGADAISDCIAPIAIN